MNHMRNLIILAFFFISSHEQSFALNRDYFLGDRYDVCYLDQNNDFSTLYYYPYCIVHHDSKGLVHVVPARPKG